MSILFYLLPSDVLICTVLEGSYGSIGATWVSHVDWNDIDAIVFLVGGASSETANLRLSSLAVVT